MSTLADLVINVGMNTREIARGAREVEGTMSKTWAGMKGAAAVGGAAIGLAVMAGVATAIEQSKPVALLEAQLGAGSAIAENAGEAAGAVYARGVVASMEDATASVKAAVQNALVPPDASTTQIADVANRISNLGTVMEEDAGRVSAAVSQMIRTGLVDSAEEGFDVLQKGVEMGVNKSEDLLDTFNEYGTQFRKIGADGPQALGMMSQALQAGARDSDTVADALKEFSIRAVDGSKTSADAFKSLGLDAEDMTAKIAKGGPEAAEGLQTVMDKLRAMKDPVKREAAAVGLFGTKAEDLGDALYAIDPKTATKGLGDLGGAADRAGTSLEESAGAKMERFKRTLEGDLVKALEKLMPAIEATFGWLADNTDWVIPLAGGLGALATAIGIIVAVQWLWNAALLLWPGTWIIAGILLLIGVIVLIATKTRFFQTIWEGVWGFLKSIGAWFAGPFVDAFVGAWQQVWDFFKSIGAWFAGPFADFFVNAWNSVLDFFRGIGAWFSGPFANFFTSMWGKIKSGFTAAVEWIKTKARNFVAFWKNLPGQISNALSSIWNPIKTGFRTAINWVIGKWNNLSFTIPSINVFGQQLGGGTISLPNIPQLASGALIKARSGGTLVNVGEGGEDEAVVPLSQMPDVAQGRGDRPVIVQLVPGGEQEFRRWFRKSVRVTGEL